LVGGGDRGRGGGGGLELCDDGKGGLVSEAVRADATWRGPGGRLILLALGLTAVRLAAAGAIHLTEDEAYYRLWAQHLQFGYFDHPPMIAWWIRAGSLVAGDTPLGIRLLPALASGLNTWLIGDLARRLGAEPRTALRAALWYNATLTVCLGGMLAIPDAPASLFWTLTLWCLARAWPGLSIGWWAAAGIAAGLGVLSKYSALFLAPGVLLWLLLIPGGAAALRRPGPWLAAVLAGGLFSVNIAWNAANHWESFDKQFGRVAPEGLAPGHLAELLGTQFLLLTPLIAIFAGVGLWRAWRGRGSPQTQPPMLLAATSAPFAVYLMAHSLHDRVQGHWPVPLFGALAICAATAAPLGRSRLAGFMRGLTPTLGFAIGAGALLIMALPAPALFGPHDPMLALRGWPQFARDVEATRVRAGAAWVGTESYGVFSQLNYENAIGAPLLEVIERDRYRKEGARIPDVTRPGLIVDISRRMVVRDVGRCFAQVTPVAELGRAGGAGKNQRYSAFLVAQPKRDVWIRGCPQEIRPGVWR
jgi:4-amino-4-deoxy-L-arabinose transferase-like glycosyltransferase